MIEKVCVVIVAGPGIDQAVSRCSAREGFKIGLVAQRIGALNCHVEQLREQGISAVGFQADAAAPASLEVAFDEVFG